jgi:hypothetical protein
MFTLQYPGQRRKYTYAVSCLLVVPEERVCTCHVSESLDKPKPSYIPNPTTAEELLAQALEMHKEAAIERLTSSKALRLQAKEERTEQEDKRFESLDIRVARVVASVNTLQVAVAQKDKDREKQARDVLSKLVCHFVVCVCSTL